MSPSPSLIQFGRLIFLTTTLLALIFQAYVNVEGVPLDITAPQSALCPVIKYETRVFELSPTELSSMQLNAKQRDEAAAAASNQAKPFQVVLIPVSYAHNASMPSVDWIDLHFKVNTATQENVQMKLKSAASVASSLGVGQSVVLASPSTPSQLDATNMRMTAMSEPSSSQSQPQQMVYAFGPIFLQPTDELSYAHTICSGMIDCISDQHSFKRQQAPVAPSAGPSTQPQAVLAPATHPSPSQPSQQPLPSTRPAVQPPVPTPAQAEVVPAAIGCPAIAYRYQISCGDSKCKVSFINLSPEKPLDWVDIHIRSNSSALRMASGDVSVSSSMVLQNYRMKLGAGMKGHMMMSPMVSLEQQSQLALSMAQREAADFAQLNSAQDLADFGSSSSPSGILSAAGGSQVWQFGLPITFQSGDRLDLWFTYCAAGTDCDTDTYQLILQEDATQQQPNQPALPTQPIPQQSQQPTSLASPHLSQQQLLLQHPSLVNQQASMRLGSSLPSLPSQSVVQQIPLSSPSPLPSIVVTTVNDQSLIPLSVAMNVAHQMNPQLDINQIHSLLQQGIIQLQ